MGKKPDKVQKTSSSTRLDPGTQAYVNQNRQMAGGFADQVMGGPSAWGGGYQPGGAYGAGYGTGGVRPQPGGGYGEPDARTAQPRNAIEAARMGVPWVHPRDRPEAPATAALGAPVYRTDPYGQQPYAKYPKLPSAAPGGPSVVPPESGYGPYGSDSYFSGPETRTPGQIADPFMNPYEDAVVGQVQSGYDRLRGEAAVGANQAATMSGAFNSSRHGVESAIRKGSLDRQEMQQIAGLRQSGYDNALNTGLNFANQQRQLMDRRRQEGLFRAQQAMGMRTGNMGPYGMDQTASQRQPGGSRFGGMLGGALSGFAMGGPWGAAAGAGAGAF